jgi:putative ABC transport system permease protein
MIALAIVVAVNGLVSSLDKLYTGYINSSVAADILLMPRSSLLLQGALGVGGEFEQKLAALPGVGDWTGVRYAGAQVEGAQVQVLGIDPLKYPQLSGLLFDAGEATAYGALAQGRNAIINPVLASINGLKMGDTLKVQTAEGVQDYKVAAIGSEVLSYKINTLYISQQNLATDFHQTEDVLLMADLAPGANPEQVKGEIAGLLQSYPQLRLQWGADWRAELQSTFNQILIGLQMLLILFIIPSLLGLVNTLAINVLERTREIGMLRALGSTERQVRRMVLAEALMLSAAGAALGIAGGLVLGYALTSILSASYSSTITYSFPWTGLLLAIAAALVMAVIASIVPARQAARLQIIKALQYE